MANPFSRAWNWARKEMTSRWSLEGKVEVQTQKIKELQEKFKKTNGSEAKSKLETQINEEIKSLKEDCKKLVEKAGKLEKQFISTKESFEQNEQQSYQIFQDVKIAERMRELAENQEDTGRGNQLIYNEKIVQLAAKTLTRKRTDFRDRKNDTDRYHKKLTKLGAKLEKIQTLQKQANTTQTKPITNLVTVINVPQNNTVKATQETNTLLKSSSVLDLATELRARLSNRTRAFDTELHEHLDDIKELAQKSKAHTKLHAAANSADKPLTPLEQAKVRFVITKEALQKETDPQKQAEMQEQFKQAERKVHTEALKAGVRLIPNEQNGTTRTQTSQTRVASTTRRAEPRTAERQATRRTVRMRQAFAAQAKSHTAGSSNPQQAARVAVASRSGGRGGI